MISIITIEQAANGSSFALAKKAVASIDERVSLVLDAAEFHHWEEHADGTRTAFFKLRKDWGGVQKGAILSLAQLHEILFPAKR